MSRVAEGLLDILVHIQTHLDGNLGLRQLSQKAGVSPSRFHRVFKSLTGETPRAYVHRLRVERGAFRLLIHDDNLLEIALDCGFQNHETFSRAFRRTFGSSPREYRAKVQKRFLHGRKLSNRTVPENVRRSRRRLPKREAAGTNSNGGSGASYQLSNTRMARLQRMHLAFLRHVGPYEAVSESLYDRLERWAVQRNIPGPRVWLGIGHDAPIATPADRLRFDAALVVPGPFSGRGAVGYQHFDGGDFAVTTHLGPLEGLSRAYKEIFNRVMSLPECRLVGLPAVEIYRTSRVNTQLWVNPTDIYLPITRK